MNYYIQTVTKKLGKPFKVEFGIQKYKKRNDLPFEELTNQVQQKIIFVSVSHEIVARFKEAVIHQIIDRGNDVTIMILDPDSRQIANKERIFRINNLSQIIREQLLRLDNLKRGLKENGNKLHIKLYDADLNYSYIVIDPESDNAIMRIEEQVGGDPELRPSSLAYKIDSTDFFVQHWTIVNNLENAVDGT